MSKVLELFGVATSSTVSREKWRAIIRDQTCPFYSKKCYKTRKSQPEISIGTCTVTHSTNPIMICPKRLLEDRKIFVDCIHLLSRHEPGNELHVVAEVPIPGGSVDYFLVSVRRQRVVDFVGIELQTLDTTGTVWPERQRFLNDLGFNVAQTDIESTRPYGMNWKMTAKTILVQLHHKVETFEALSRRLVLVVQDHLVDYMSSEFSFGHLSSPALAGDTLQMHGYQMQKDAGKYRIQLARRYSTDASGVAKALELNVSANVSMDTLVALLESKISRLTLLRVA